jgi:hypothetical protein
MCQKTKSEAVFEEYLVAHNLRFDPIAVAHSPRPDYVVTIGSSKILFEVKELSEDENFQRTPLAVSSRKVGDHIRRKITQASKYNSELDKVFLLLC